MVKTVALRCHAEFKITGVELEPENLTSLLGLVPTKCWTAQEKGKSSMDLASKEGGWILSTHGRIISKFPEDHILWLMDQFIDLKEHSVQFQKMDLNPRFIVQCFSVSDFLEIRFSDIVMVKLAECNIPIFLDCWKS